MITRSYRPAPTNTFGVWLWLYLLSRLVLDPLLLIRSLHHVTSLPYLALTMLLAVVGAVAALLVLLRKPAALALVGLELCLRLVTDCAFYVHTLTHPLRVVRNPGVHFATALIVTLVFGVLPTSLWFLYFNQSRRVRSLFGANLFPGLIPPGRTDG